MRPLDPAARRTRAVAAAALALGLSACQLVVASSTTTGTGDPLTATPVPLGVVETLGLGDLGQGTVSWWAADDQVALPDALQPMGGFVPAGDVGIIDVVVPTVTPALSTPPATGVVLRPAWSTTIDNESTTAAVHGIADDVTIAFAAPGSPGQVADAAGREVLDVDVEAEVAAGTCEQLVALQTWQVGPTELDEADGSIQAEYLGSVVVRAPCA